MYVDPEAQGVDRHAGVVGRVGVRRLQPGKGAEAGQREDERVALERAVRQYSAPT